MSSSTPPGDYDDEGAMVYAPNILGNSGSMHSVSSDAAEVDRVAQLREVVAEVTNGRIPVPPRRRFGFY